ncbi:hypothetical protein D3C85_1394820 [compost metagenome]
MLGVRHLDDLGADALGKVAEGRVGAGGAHHHVAGRHPRAQEQRDQAVGAGVDHHVGRIHAVQRRGALADGRGVRVRIQPRQLVQHLAPLCCQRVAGNRHALVGADARHDAAADGGLQPWQALERVDDGALLQVAGVAGHGGLR